MLKEIFNKNIANTPWPTIVNGSKYAGHKVSLTSICNKCDELQCLHLGEGSNEGTCRHGFFYKSQEVNDVFVVVYGIVVDKACIPKYQYLKDIMKKSYVEKKDVVFWFSCLRDYVATRNDEDIEIIRGALNPFHDTNRLAREIANIAEEYVSRSGGGTFVEKLNAIPNDIKTIYKASVLLLDTFDSANIYFNPGSAKFGRPKSTEIYRLLDKLVYILNMAQMKSNKIRILYEGSCHRSYKLYESFKLMPLALLQNSIKYSSADNVKLTIQEISNKYQVSVESVGPLIEVDELVNIFKKGVRGKWAEKKTNEGLGIGLYIASMVAVAHNLRIDCVSEPMGYNRDDIPQARNTFSFCLPLVGETL